jgi:uncharacterized protein YlbG (UPF0298 family)
MAKKMKMKQSFLLFFYIKKRRTPLLLYVQYDTVQRLCVYLASYAYVR